MGAACHNYDDRNDGEQPAQCVKASPIASGREDVCSRGHRDVQVHRKCCRPQDGSKAEVLDRGTDHRARNRIELGLIDHPENRFGQVAAGEQNIDDRKPEERHAAGRVALRAGQEKVSDRDERGSKRASDRTQ
eukprot:318445-Prymnesium_polylepis.1